MSNTQVITIDNITIKQDSEGRFCLNDFHKAAGGEARHQPSLFFQLDSTKELITELSNSRNSLNKNPVSAKAGRYGGTFVTRPLVFAYAMWVSAEFHLKVIEFFDRGQTQGVADNATWY